MATSLFSSSSANFLKTLRKSQLFFSAFEICRARCHSKGIYLILSSGVVSKKNCSFFIYLANPMLIIHRAVARLESWSCCDRDSVEVPIGDMFPVPGRRTRLPSTKSRTVRWVRSEASWNKISFVTLALWCTQDRRDYQSLDRVSLLHIYFFGYCSLNAHGENMSMEERTTG